MKKVFSIIALAAFFVLSLPVDSYAQSVISPITHTLAFQAQGYEVSFLQQFLKDRGFFNYPTITGFFGPITKQAVMDFQKAYGLVVDGIVGPVTRAKIAELMTPVEAAATPVAVVKLPVVRKGGTIHHRSAPDAIAPEVSITTPTSDQTLAGPITIEADASDNVGVLGVQFKVDDMDLGPEDLSLPYAIDFDVGELSSGPHEFTAVARDAAGNTTTSAAVLFVVDYTAPAISITDPTDATLNTDPVVLSADVVDASDIDSVEFRIYEDAPPNEMIYEHVFDAEPYSISWSNNAADGAYVFEVTARDVAGNTSVETYSFTVTADVPSYALIVAKSGIGTGIVNSTPAGISCGVACAASYDENTMVTLTATPSMGSIFVGWSGAGCVGTDTCVVSMTEPTTVTATFTSILEA